MRRSKHPLWWNMHVFTSKRGQISTAIAANFGYTIMDKTTTRIVLTRRVALPTPFSYHISRCKCYFSAAIFRHFGISGSLNAPSNVVSMELRQNVDTIDTVIARDSPIFIEWMVLLLVSWCFNFEMRMDNLWYRVRHIFIVSVNGVLRYELALKIRISAL